MTAQHTCAHPGCTYKVNPPHVLCSQHWFAVPPRVKAAIQQRIHGWRNRDEAANFYRSYLSNLARQGAR